MRKISRELVVEHKGNALRPACFCDLCAGVSAASGAVRFRAGVVRLPCAPLRPAEGRFSRAPSQSVAGSHLVFRGLWPDDYRIEITLRVAREQ
jgi:hypothetical protein